MHYKTFFPTFFNFRMGDDATAPTFPGTSMKNLILTEIIISTVYSLALFLVYIDVHQAEALSDVKDNLLFVYVPGRVALAIALLLVKLLFNASRRTKDVLAILLGACIFYVNKLGFFGTSWLQKFFVPLFGNQTPRFFSSIMKEWNNDFERWKQYVFVGICLALFGALLQFLMRLIGTILRAIFCCNKRNSRKPKPQVVATSSAAETKED